MSSKSLISVIIPCYNQGRFVAEAIESVFAQRDGDYEIIVINDGSTDDSASVIRRYPHVVCAHQQNQGLATSRNHGLRVSHGEYVVFLDADDRLLPGHFETSRSLLKTRPEIALVFGDHRLLGTSAGHEHDCSPRPDHYGALLRHNLISCPATAMTRREIIGRVGDFRIDVPGAEDYEFYLRIAAGHVLYCHHQPVAEYRQHPEQMSRRWDVMLRGCVRALRLQRPHVERRPAYKEAYREGLRTVRQRYGEPLLWETTNAMRQGDYQRLRRNVSLLLQYYPRGLVRHFGGKLRRAADVRRPAELG